MDSKKNKLDYDKEFKKILLDSEINLSDFSKLSGIPYATLKSSRSKGVPRWIKTFVIGYRQALKNVKKEITSNNKL